MKLKKIFERELSNPVLAVVDNWEQNGILYPQMKLEFLIFSIGKHHFSISICESSSVYVISEIEKPTRDCYEIPDSIRTLSRKGMSEYIKRLCITSVEN